MSRLERLALLALLCISIFQRTIGLLKIPNNVHSYSQYLSCKGWNCSSFVVDEFISVEAGGVRLDIEDHQSHSPHDDGVVNYFRLAESVDQTDKSKSAIIKYDPNVELCSLDNLNQWPLASLSRFLDQSSSDNNFLGKDDGFLHRQLYIGPLALVRFVEHNSRSFRLEQKSFNKMNLADCYYFTTDLMRLDLSSNERVRMVAVFPINGVKLVDDTKVKVGETMLSQMASIQHLSMIHIVTAATNEDAKKLFDMPASDLIDNTKILDNQLELIMILYDLIEDLRLDQRNLGQLRSNSDYSITEDVFSLPTGAGCGLILPDSVPMFINSRQFSGSFKASSFPDQYYVAFDELMGLFRYDTLGEFKLIYSQEQQIATMIETIVDDGNGREGQPIGDKHDLEQIFEDQTHCAQYVQSKSNEKYESKLFKAKSIGDILGIGPEVGVGYLGTQILTDNNEQQLCQVYEREVVSQQVPILLQLHNRLRVKPDERLFLDYYFTSASVDSKRGQPGDRPGLEGMKLRRIRLISHDERFQWPIARAQLTFDEFSWSLENFDNLDSSGDSEDDLHPARVFDTLECISQNDRANAELILKQEDSSNWLFIKSSLSDIHEQFQTQLDKFEIGLARILQNKLDSTQFRVNKLGVELMDNSDSLRAKFVLSGPMAFEHHSELMGWVAQVELLTQVMDEDKPSGSLPAGQLIKKRRGMTLEECSLRVVTGLGKQQQHLTHMFLCPMVGCGHIRSFKWEEVAQNSLRKFKNSGDVPDLNNFQRMCLVYTLKRYLRISRSLSSYSDQELKVKFLGTSIQISLAQKGLDNSVSLQMYEGRVDHVHLDSNVHHESWDTLLQNGVCYTKSTKYKSVFGSITSEQLDELNANIQILALPFDKHHSIRQCHQACLMSQSCSSYSYNSRDHRCSLANFEREIFSDAKIYVIGLARNSSCKLFAMSQHLRYKRKFVSTVIKPRHLLEDKQPILVVGLSTCASLCHRNEAPKRKGRRTCRSFIYVRSHSLCKLTDGQEYPWDLAAAGGLQDTYDITIYGSLISKEQHGIIKDETGLIQYLGEHQVDLVGNCEAYERNFVAFKSRTFVKLELKQPAAADETPIAGQLVSSQLVNRQSSLSQCIAECSHADPDCVALDFYIQTQTRASMINYGSQHNLVCILYHIRSPMSIDEQFFHDAPNGPFKIADQSLLAESATVNGLELLPIERKFYSIQQSDYSVSLASSTGWHYFITGDALYLKRQIANALSDYSKQANKSDSGQQTDADYLIAQMDDEGRQQSLAVPSRSTSMAVIILDLSLSLIGGFLIFISVELARDYGIINLQESPVDCNLFTRLIAQWRRPRTDSSLSQIELAQMEIQPE